MVIPYPPTARQQQLLRFIAAYMAEHGGVAPSLREMSAAIGCSARSTAKRILDGLEERGHIRRVHHHERAIEIIARPRPGRRTALLHPPTPSHGGRTARRVVAGDCHNGGPGTSVRFLSPRDYRGKPIGPAMTQRSMSRNGTVKAGNHVRLPRFLAALLGPKRVPPRNPGRDLALIGAMKRKAESKAFHREMRERLGLPARREFEDC